MSFINLSNNMLLPIPGVGQEPGPDWATDINNCLTIIDQHTHEVGSGIQITPAGMNINADLSISSNNLTTIRTVRLNSQSAVLSLASDLRCLYAVGVDLYYNDGAGNQVRITQSGGVAGTPGSISNLTSPASAAYVSGTSTFVWQSAALTPANLDCASVLLRNLTASSKSLTLNPPNAMASDISYILPSLPASQKIVTLDASGNWSAPYTIGGTAVTIASNIIDIPDHGLTQIKNALMTTGTTVAAGGYAVSASSGSFSGAFGTPTPVTNLSVTITTTGRPVRIQVASASATGTPGLSIANSTNTAIADFYIYRDATPLNKQRLRISIPGATAVGLNEPPGYISAVDIVAAGTYTYTLQVETSGGGGVSVGVDNCQLEAYEL